MVHHDHVVLAARPGPRVEPREQAYELFLEPDVVVGGRRAGAVGRGRGLRRARVAVVAEGGEEGHEEEVGVSRVVHEEGPAARPPGPGPGPPGREEIECEPVLDAMLHVQPARVSRQCVRPP